HQPASAGGRTRCPPKTPPAGRPAPRANEGEERETEAEQPSGSAQAPEKKHHENQTPEQKTINPQPPLKISRAEPTSRAENNHQQSTHNSFRHHQPSTTAFA